MFWFAFAEERALRSVFASECDFSDVFGVECAFSDVVSRQGGCCRSFPRGKECLRAGVDVSSSDQAFPRHDKLSRAGTAGLQRHGSVKVDRKKTKTLTRFCGIIVGRRRYDVALMTSEHGQDVCQTMS